MFRSLIPVLNTATILLSVPSSNYSEPQEQDGTSVAHEGTTLEHGVTTIRYDGMAFDLTLKDQVRGHTIIPKGDHRRSEGSYTGVVKGLAR